jgi:hypothetical protein
VVALGKKSFPWQMSLGADAANFERIPDGEKVTVNGRSFKGPILVARGAVVREVSFVALGADAATSAGVAAQRGGDTSMNFEQWLQSKAFDPAALSEGQKAVLKAAYDAEQKPPAPVVQAGTQTATATRPAEAPTQTLDDIVAAARAEEERKTKVTEIVARFIQENPSQLELAEALGRQAIEGKWKVDRWSWSCSASGGRRACPPSPGRTSRKLRSRSSRRRSVGPAGCATWKRPTTSGRWRLPTGISSTGWAWPTS